MKKILLLANCPLKHDGVTKIELDIIEYCKNDIRIEMACGYMIDREYRNYFERENIIYHQLPSKKHLLQYIKGIKRLVKKEQYDSVYIHGNSSLMLLEVLATKLGHVCNVVTHCHNTNSNYKLLHYLVKPVFNMLVDIKIGCSELASHWAYFGNNFITIVNGIDILKYKYDKAIRLEIRKELDWDVNNTVVGHIGRFSKQKNHEKIISIFKKYHESNKESRLLLIGEGELKSEICKTIEKMELAEYVKIISYTDRPQDYMQAMDVMIMPSLFEGLGLVAIEAQANGLPVIISNWFPKETKATELVEVIDLEESDNEWCSLISEAINCGRRDVISQLFELGYDSSVMLKKILEILQR